MAVLTFRRRAGLIASMLAAMIAVAACDWRPGAATKPAFNAVDITGAEYANALNLPDASGRQRSLADFKGKVTLVFFGYTQCPDVCPATLAELAAVKQALGSDGDKVQGVFVTVDPKRDTPEVLKAYVGSFDPGFVALRGDEAQIQAVAKNFKVFYALVPGKTEGSYTVDHTAGTFVFDTAGRVRLFVRYGGGAEALAHDIKLLLAQDPG